MKKYLLLLAALPFAAAHATAQNDTIADVQSPQRVLITQADSLVNIRINGAKNDNNYRFQYQIPTNGASLVEERGARWNFSLPFSAKQKTRNKKSSSTLSAGSLTMGMNYAVGSSPSHWKPINAFTIDLTFLTFSHNYDRHTFSVGWGYGWSKYRLSSDETLTNNNGKVSIVKHPDGAPASRSVFRVNRHFFNFLYRYKFAKRWHVFTGVQLNLNHRPRIYNTTYIGNTENFETIKKNIHLNSITTTFLGGLSWRSIGVFANYTPASLFEKGFGPKTQEISVGISFAY